MRRQETETHPPEVTAEELRAALAELPQEMHLPIVLHFLHGLSQPQVAQALQIPVGTVGSRIARGLNRLRQRIEEGRPKTAQAAFPALGLGIALSALPLCTAPGNVGAIQVLQTLAGQSKYLALTASAAKAASYAGISLTTKCLLALVVVSALSTIAVLAVMPPKPLVETGGEEAPAPAPVPAPAPPLQPKTPRVLGTPGAELAKKLAARVNVRFRRTSMGVFGTWLSNMDIEMAYPAVLAPHIQWSFEATQVTVRAVLERMAEETGLQIEYTDSAVLYWKPAGDEVIAGLEEMLRSKEAQTRAEAVWRFSHLADRRVFPLLLSAIGDPDSLVASWAIRRLCSTHRWYGYVMNHPCSYFPEVKRSTDILVDLLQAGVRSKSLTGLLCYTRQPKAFDALLPLLAQKNLQLGNAICSALQRARYRPAIPALLAELSTNNPNAAANALAEIGEPECVDALISHFRSKADYFGTTACALGTCKDPRAIAALLDALTDPQQEGKVSSIYQGLIGSCDPRAKSALINILRDGTDAQKINVAYMAAGSSDPEVVRALIPLFESSNTVVRRQALISLHSQDQHFVEPLLKLLEVERVAENRGFAMQALASTQAERGVDYLLKLAESSDAKEKEHAFYALPYSGSPLAVNPLLNALHDDGLKDKGTYLYGLKRLDLPEADAELFKHHSQNESSLWTAAANGELKRYRILITDDELERLLKNNSAQTVAAGLAFAGDRLKPAQFEYICERLKTEDQEGRCWLCLGLGRYGSPRIVPVLLGLLADPSPKVRANAIYELHDTGDPRGLAAIRKCRDQDPEVSKALQAVLKAPDESLVPPLTAPTEDF